MAIRDTNQPVAVQRFRDSFKACLEGNRVRPDRSNFYFKWVQTFVDFRPEKKLRDRSADDIRLFLENLRNRPGIEKWLVQQVEHSLKGEGEDAIQRAVRNAALLSGGSKKMSCHTLRHSLSSRLLETGYISFRYRGFQAMQMFSPPRFTPMFWINRGFQSKVPWIFDRQWRLDSPPFLRFWVPSECMHLILFAAKRYL